MTYNTLTTLFNDVNAMAGVQKIYDIGQLLMMTLYKCEKNEVTHCELC